LKRVRLVIALLALMAAGVAATFAIPAIGARFSAFTTVTIKVTATEYKFALSKRSVSPGTTVSFKVTNKGKVTHNFKILGKKTPLIQPGKTAILKSCSRRRGSSASSARCPATRSWG
jgi:plastocyanin